MIPFLVPPIAGAIGWVLLLSDRAGLLNAVLRWALAPLGYTSLRGPFNIYSWPGLIFVYVIYSVPYAYMMMASGLRNLDASLEEQSRICGRGALATLLRVTFPAVLPSVGAACTLLIWLGFSLFSVPVIIGQGAGISVLSVQLVRLLTFTYPPQMAAAVGLGLILVATLGAAWFVQGRILRSGRFATIGGKGRRAAPVRLGIWKGPARFCVLAYVAVAAVLPAGALVLVALNGFWTPRIKWGALGLDTFRDVLTDELTARSLLNSLSLAIVGATIGILVAAILALFVQRSSRRLGRVVDLLIKLPASISSIVLAVGFILAFSGAPFYLNGTYLILLLGYLALYLPQGSVSADAAAAQVGRELSEASQVAGASDGRTLMRISLPLMAPGLVAGWALLFVRMLSDLTVSSVLAGTSNPVVGFRILDVYQGGSFAMLAALSTLVTLVSAVVIIGLMMFSRRRQSHA
jgi:iron(III) transport system permease protein